MLRVALALALASSAVPSTALACSPACDLGVSPFGTESAPAHLPANGAFFVLRAGPIGLARTTLTVARTRAGVTATFTLVPGVEPVAIDDARPGDHIVVTFDGFCHLEATREVTTVIDVTPVAPLPTTLGVLEVEASRATQVAVWDNRGGCASDLASTAAPYHLALDPTLAPWADALTTQAMLDDAPWNEPPDARVAPHFVFAPCASLLPSQTASGASTGEHRLRIEGTLRGMSTMLASNEARFELTCGSGSGCAAAPGTRSDLVWLGALGLVGACWARRRSGCPRDRS